MLIFIYISRLISRLIDWTRLKFDIFKNTIHRVKLVKSNVVITNKLYKDRLTRKNIDCISIATIDPNKFLIETIEYTTDDLIIVKLRTVDTDDTKTSIVSFHKFPLGIYIRNMPTIHNTRGIK